MNDIWVMPSGSTFLVEMVLQYIGTAAFYPSGKYRAIKVKKEPPHAQTRESIVLNTERGLL